ncbi:MAG: hypothetical protein NTY37_07910 [Methanothrix sp.]|nr:hypothetical protein [Methanothrix sp.]
MFAEYIKAALERAEYEIMKDDEPEPYYAHVHEGLSLNDQIKDERI